MEKKRGFRNYTNELQSKMNESPIWIANKNIPTCDGTGVFEKDAIITDMEILKYYYTINRCKIQIHTTDMPEDEYRLISIQPDKFYDYFRMDEDLNNIINEKIEKKDKKSTIILTISTAITFITMFVTSTLQDSNIIFRTGGFILCSIAMMITFIPLYLCYFQKRYIKIDKLIKEKK